MSVELRPAPLERPSFAGLRPWTKTLPRFQNKGRGDPALKHNIRKHLEYLAQLVDLVVVGFAQKVVLSAELCTHQLAGMAVAGEIAYGEIYTFFDDQLVVADVHHDQLILLLDIGRTLVFTADGIEEDIIGAFRKCQKAQLRVVEKALDKMELDQHLLFEELGAIEKDLMVLEIVDVFNLERRHPYFPNHTAGRGAELDILRCDQRFCQSGLIMLLRQHLMREIQVILIDERPVETFSLLIE